MSIKISKLVACATGATPPIEKPVFLLPSSALASSWVSTYGVTGYANIRKQFNIPLSKMQGVQEKLANMTYNTLLIDSALR